MGHTASLKITAAGEKVASCGHCVELEDRLEKLIAETRIIVSMIQKEAKRRKKPAQELIDINEEIAEALVTLEKITDDASDSLDVQTVQEIQQTVKVLTGGKPLLLMPKGQIIKGVGASDVLEDLQEYDEPSDMVECLKCDDAGVVTNKNGMKIPCKWCNPEGKLIAIPGDHVKCPWCHADGAVVGACLRCDGCGYVPYDTVYTAQGICRTCNGAGSVYDADAAVPFACTFCEGFGKDPSMVNTENKKPAGKTVCGVCKGVGKTFKLPTKSAVTCWKCAGDGYID